jgi:hypothetical protein
MTDEHDVARDLMKGDEDISPWEFAADEAREPDFGNWPELVGVVGTAVLIWFTFAFTG